MSFTPYEFGRFVYEQGGSNLLGKVVKQVYNNQGLLEAGTTLAGAASYYNPYITAASVAAPVLYNGAKWLVDKVF